MKRKLLVFVMSAFVLGAFAQTNLMVGQNGSFEDGTIDHWRMLEINAGGFFGYVLGEMPEGALGNIAIIDDATDGDKALEFTWPVDPGLAEILLDKWDTDKFLPVTPGTDYIFKADAYASEGAGNILRMAIYFFAEDSVSGVAGGDMGDISWVLGDFYETHSWTVNAPADAAHASIGFRVYGTDGARWNTVPVVSVIDNIQFWEGYDATAVNEMSQETFSIYPNPVQDNLNIRLDDAIRSVEIYSITGQLVKEFNGNTTTMNVAELSTGVYFVKVDSEAGSGVKKMLKK